jgi:mevalonate kinase
VSCKVFIDISGEVLKWVGYRYSFKSFRFLLTDSRVPRDTKKLVAGVAAKKLAVSFIVLHVLLVPKDLIIVLLQEPAVVEHLLDSIQSISNEARRALGDPELPRDALLSALAALIRENHAHLVALGVSHPVLEAILTQAAAEPYRLSTKLTGAGGGGCAVTLIPDGVFLLVYSFDCTLTVSNRLEGERFACPH